MKKEIILIPLMVLAFICATNAQTETVGALNGNLSVSPSGAAVYTIGIDLPSGRGGLTPQLALQYNSQGETGVLGKGWGVSGWSFVERVGGTMYYDNVEVPGAVDFTDDRFSLNGMRIIKVSQNPSVSRLETDDVTRITQPPRTTGKTAMNTDKNNFWYWKVQSKDGLTKHFGDTDESRQSKGENMLPVRWHLNRIDDLLGNSIMYEYDKKETDGEIYLKKIDYYPYEVVFEYNNLDQNFQMTSYFPHGNEVYWYSVKKVMTGIAIYYSPTKEKIKEYALDYENGGIFNREFLKQVSLEGMNGESLIATNFEWEYNPGGYGEPVYTLNETHDEYYSGIISTATGDFNGDGKTDFVENDGHEGKTKVYINNVVHNINFLGYSIVGDFFGEGVDNIFIRETTGQKRQRIYSYRDGAFVQVGSDRYNIQIMHTGDFTGNGLTDLITKEGSTYYIYPGTTNSVSFFTTTNRKAIGGYPSNIIKTGNFRGNSQIGFLTYGNGTSVNCFNLKIDNGVYTMESHLNSQYNLNVTPIALETGDFNGDGKDDLIVVYYDDGIKQAIYYSNGKGFVKKNISLGHNWWADDYLILDLNNDGVADIYYQTITEDWVNQKYMINYKCLYKHSGVNAGFVAESGFEEFSLPQDIIDVVRHPLLYGDFNGNGKKEVSNHFEVVYGDIVSGVDSSKDNRRNQTWRRWFYFKNSTSPDDRITQITNGLGMNQRITYEPYSPIDHRHQYDYPVMKYRYPFSTVHTIETQMPNSKDYFPPTTYEYAGMQVHAQGKGMLGFQATVVMDEVTNTQTATLSDLFIKDVNGTPHYFHPYTNTVRTKDLTTNKTISRTDIQTDIKNLVNGKPLIFLPVATNTTTTTFDNNAENSLISRKVALQSINDIDTYGNSTKRVERATFWTWQTDPSTKWMFNDSIRANYLPPSPDKWIILPDWTETYKCSSEDDYKELINRVEFDYNAKKLLETKAVFPGGEMTDNPLITQESYTYDNYGNLETLNLSAPQNTDLPTRSTTFEYDATRRFVAKKTIHTGTVNNLITEYGYYPALGLLKWEKDIRGNTTVYVYDGFGKLTETHHPDGTSSYSKVEWLDHQYAPKGATYQVTGFKQVDRETWHESTVFFDLLGRELRSLTYNLQGDPVAVDKEYDQLCRLYSVSEPFNAGGGPRLFTTYTYDGLGRNTEVTLPDGTKSVTTYNGRTIRTTNNATNVWSEKISNAIGLTDWSKDPAGQINYDYNGRGQLIQVVALGQKSTINYDLAGNQQELIDPNAGTTSYIYNAYGELISQTDANGNTYEMKYDDIGRLQEKELKSGGTDLTEYIYYTTRTDNGFGLPQRTQRSNNTAIDYTYDELGRVSEKTETVDQNSFTFAYGYNKHNGMLETYTYPGTDPDRFGLVYGYNPRGQMHEVRRADDNQLLWKANRENDRGQLTDYIYGNSGLHGLRDYDDYGFPKQLYVVDFFKDIPKVALDLNYVFNPATGNLTSRADYLHNQTESFTYDTDKLHSRLTGWKVNGQTVASLVYGDNGNITKKSDVSAANDSYTYQHPQGKPHAVTGIIQPTAGFVAESYPQSVEYTAFNKVRNIFNQTSNPAYNLHFTYGPDDQRRRTMLYRQWPGVVETMKYFIDNYELEYQNMGGDRELHYLNGPDGLFAIMVKQGSTETMYYVHKDYLGSISAITDATGNLIESLSYDPWGRRRKATDWADYNVTSTMFDRGFTGHEHLPQFGLINMNGRVYDPFLARFLSPDPFVQAPSYTQNYNRYSYAWNNPLKYTDPDGEWVHLAFGAMIGGYLNVVANAKNIQNPWQMLGYFGVGAVAGGLSAGIGAGIGTALAGNVAGGGFAAGFMGTAAISSTGFVAGAISGAAAGFTNGLVSGTGNQLIQGKKFGDAFVNGGLGQAWRQGLGGAAIGGIAGGIHAKNNSRNFWTGDAITYKDTPALYASVDGAGSIYTETDDYSVFNSSGKDVFYKPEDGLYGLRNRIPNGEGIKLPVDGIATIKHTDMVFKIPGKYGFGANAHVVYGGDVRLSFSPIDKLALNAYRTLNSSYTYGWMTLDELDSGWEQLFKLAKIIK